MSIISPIAVGRLIYFSSLAELKSCFNNLKIEKNSQPFLSARSNTTKEDHIIGWTCEYKKGKTVYNALGHDSESLKNPYMIDIIEKSLEWLSGDKFVKN